MTDWVETHRGVVFPWLCDHFGHMNVRYYTHFFDDGGFHIWSQIGIGHAEMRARGIALVVARNTVDYIHELRAGDLLVVKGAFTALGTKSIRHVQKMFNVDSGVLCATQESVEVFFDPATRKAAPMPDDIRAKVAASLVAAEGA